MYTAIELQIWISIHFFDAINGAFFIFEKTECCFTEWTLSFIVFTVYFISDWDSPKKISDVVFFFF